MGSCVRSSTGNSSLTQVLSCKNLAHLFTVIISKAGLTQVLSWKELVLLFTVFIPKDALTQVLRFLYCWVESIGSSQISGAEILVEGKL